MTRVFSLSAGSGVSLISTLKRTEFVCTVVQMSAFIGSKSYIEPVCLLRNTTLKACVKV